MTLKTRKNKLAEKFIKKFNVNPTDYFISPGRIELLGNHTDHNNGKVLVSSVNLNILAATRIRDDGKVVFYSKGFRKIAFSINRLSKREKEVGTSISLIRGVLYKMKQLGYKIGGFSCCADSIVPKGAGVSSSASFEVLIAKLISYYYNNDSIQPLELAKIAQYSETQYFGKPCGLLDQCGIALGGINYIDFKDTNKPLINNIHCKIKNHQFILINTGDDHSNLTHCYSQIKEDMRIIANHYCKDVLREVVENEFINDKEKLIQKYGERIFFRGKHYFDENTRVEAAYNSLLNKNQINLLSLMNKSGLSSYHQLKNCYVDNEDEKLPVALKFVKELDPNCYSRVHGGGFAGTILMIIHRSKLKEILPLLKEKFGKENVIKIKLIDYGTTRLKEEEICKY